MISALALCLAALLSGCSSRSHTDPAAAGRAGHSSSAPDSLLFSSVVQAIAREERQPIRVDPRPLRGNPAITFFVRPEDLAEVDPAIVQGRSRVLARLGIERFTLFDNSCEGGPGGFAPPVAPDDSAAVAAELRRRAEARRPLCVLVGLPRAGGAFYPPRSLDERSSGADHVTTRVVTISHGIRSVYDVVASPTRDEQGWRVVKVVTLDRAWS